MSDASFSISAASSAKQIKVTMALKYQDLNQGSQSSSGSTYPTSVTTTTETKNGKQYKVYDIKMSGMTALNNERLSNVEATLVYEISSTGAIGALLASDSTVTFTQIKCPNNCIWLGLNFS